MCLLAFGEREPLRGGRNSNVGDVMTVENIDGGDIEAGLDKRLQELEAERARHAQAAIDEGRKQELAARLERERSAAVATIEGVIQQTGAHFRVLPGKLYEMLLKNDLPVSEEGLRKLATKFPDVADSRTTRKLLANAPDEQEEPKPPKRSDFPSTKDGFPAGWSGAEMKSKFVAAFGYDEWAAMPATATVLKDIESLTTAEYYRLPNARRLEIVNKLIAQNDDVGSYLKRISKNRPQDS